MFTYISEFQWTISVVFLLQRILLALGGTADNCPPADPICHPSCIVYDVNHCRYCRCPSQGLNSGFSRGSSNGDWGGGSGSTDTSWDNEFSNDGDWSSRVGEDNSWKNSGVDNSWSSSDSDNSKSNSWSNSGNSFGDSGGFSSNNRYGSNENSHYTNSNSERVQYIIVEKDSQPSYSGSPFSGGGPFPDIQMSRSPFASVGAVPSSLSPGSNDIIDSRSFPGQVIHVPLVAPGLPRYCVRCPILSCPSTCERVDEWGCHSCPCAPSRFQTMPVARDCSNQDLHHRQPACTATKLCIESCRDNYRLGDMGSDGCRTCACFRLAPRTTPRPEAPSCPATLKCMLKCGDGYILGDKQRDGCPSCRCLSQAASNHRNNSGHNDNKNNSVNNNWSNNWNGNNNNNNYNNNNGGRKKGCSRNNNFLSSTNGIGSGKCEPPMCLDGHMSVDAAMRMGQDSVSSVMSGGGMEDDCTDGVLDGGSIDGMGTNFGDGFSSKSGGFTGSNSMGTGTGGTKGSGTGMSGDCFPMCQNGQNNQLNTGSNGGSSLLASRGSSGCSGPFCATMSGAGAGGMNMGGDGGAGGMKGFSPFSAAMIGGGGPGVGMPMPPASGGLSTPGEGPTSGGPTPGPRAGGHVDCPDLIHCLVTCDGRYILGDLDQNGCQTCSCK